MRSVGEPLPLGRDPSGAGESDSQPQVTSGQPAGALSSAHLGLWLAVLNMRRRSIPLCSRGRGVRGLLPLPGVRLLLLLLHQAVGERSAGAEDPAATRKPCRGLSPAKR